MISESCFSCGSANVSTFYDVSDVPVHSVLLLSTREEALNYPKGDIKLGFCHDCGFIFNRVFDPSLHEYSSKYDPTQAFSSTFNAFHRNLATRLIEQYDLHGKTIIEIGCGQGEFLTLLCELADNRGIGFDPAYIPSDQSKQVEEQVTFIQDFYSEKYTDVQGDFICCKMTLEHIQDTSEVVRMVRSSIGDQPDTVVFFQVPNVTYILRELAFWDIYYEHCSYFSLGSIARLFRRCGFEVINLAREYDDQYLMIETRPGNGQGGAKLKQENDLAELKRDVAYFAENYKRRIEEWRSTLQKISRNKQRAVIWGAGSKGVTFLNILKAHDEIGYAVDINPRKHGAYMAGTGQEIVSPAFLGEYQPDVVIVMNPIYHTEIQQDLERIGVTAELKMV